MKKAFVIVFLTALGCQSEKIDAGDQALGKDFSLKINQQTRVDGFSLAFDKVADSRCPANAVCIRAGEVVVDLNVDAQQKIQMCLGECQLVQPNRRKGFVTQDSLEVSVNSKKYLLVLKQVNPYPVIPTTEADRSKYEVVMQVTGR